jgi:uncharacterized protein YidB (DUF937 family)
MGLLDDLVSELGGSLEGNAGAHQDLLQGVMGMFANSGGLAGLASAFQRGGLGHLVSSWISTGQNLPVSAAQITQVLGSQKVSELAAKVGLSPQAAGASLAQLLPALVDRMTPNGQIPQGGGGLLGGLLGALGGKQS